METPVMKSESRLERVVRSGRFAITAELNPPDSTDPEAVYERALALSEFCDAINVTDGSGANARMSSLAACVLLKRAGYEPIMQIACRDRNRIAMQGDLLGAAALGIQNVLCLTGDGVQVGDQPEAKPVFDLDSVGLLNTARIMRDKGVLLSGRTLDVPPKFFLGAASNPFAPPYDFRPLQLAKKVQAGAGFVQTQFCFDVDRLQKFMSVVRDMGLNERVCILVGVGPLRSAKSAEWIRTNVPGINIPDKVIKRLKGAPKGKQKEEGIQLCIEIIQQVREIEGICGVHLMAHRQEEAVGQIIQKSGLLPSP